MLFGEIDCREGLLISVQKGRYNDIAEGAVMLHLAALASCEELAATQ